MNLPNIDTEILKQIRVIRLLEGQLLFSNIDLHVSLEFDGSDKKPDIKSKIKAMMIWINEYLNGSVLYNVLTEHDTTLFEEITNHVVMCPDEPHDYLVAMLIHSKLQAFGGNQVRIKFTSVQSDTSDGFCQKISGDAALLLPDMKIWIGQRHFHAAPWWCRDDSSTVDMKPEDSDDLNKIPELGDQLIDCIESTSAEIIKPAFKPRIITNDE